MVVLSNLERPVAMSAHDKNERQVYVLAVDSSSNKLAEARPREHNYRHLEGSCNCQQLPARIKSNLVDVKLDIRSVQYLPSPVRFNSGLSGIDATTLTL